MDLSGQYDKDKIPWELIAASFEGDLPGEEAAELERWLNLEPGHRENYGQLRKIWQEGLADYESYLGADASKSWELLQSRMRGSGLGAGNAGPNTAAGGAAGKVFAVAPAGTVENTDVPGYRAAEAPLRKMYSRILSVAAALLLLALGAGWWYFSGKARTGGELVYESDSNQGKTVSLSDGSRIELKPGTRIAVDGGFGRSNRLLTLLRGEAFFDVRHSGGREYPFTVELDGSSVQDIGTRFTILKSSERVSVTVLSGKVAFTRKSADNKGVAERKELSGGMSLSYRVSDHNFGEIVLTGFVGDSSRNLLEFHEAPLSAVVEQLRLISGNKIILADSGLSERRLTARLDGESFDSALQIVCESLNLGFTKENGAWLLRKKAGK